MQILSQRFKQIMTVSLVSALFSVCSPVFAETAEHKDEHKHAEKSVDWPGIYNGSTPCADCIGVKTTLALNKNGSYMMMTQFLGKSEREYVEKGKFTWSDKANTIVLTPKNGSSSQQYLVGDNALIQLDANGNRYSGKGAERYTLRRNDVSNTPPEHSGH